MSDERTPFEDNAQNLLRNSAEQLDGRTRSRLNQARQSALAEVARGRNWAVRWMAPIGVAAAGTLAVALFVGRTPESTVQTAAVAVEDIELMTAEDSLEMYENLEFYAWLDEVATEESQTQPAETKNGVG